MLPMDVLRVIDAKAMEHDIPVGNLAAIVDVESRGQVFATVSGKQLPVILFEPHILYRRSSGAARAELVRAGLASQHWNKRLYAGSQPGRWKQIADAAAILEKHGQPKAAAYESASYGVGQVLGYHWEALGYASFDAFFQRMVSGADGQVEIMLQYIVVNHLDDVLRNGRWPAFFRGYNGPAWRKNGYGDKIEEALELYGGKSAEADGMLRMGAKGQRVRELQALLLRAGYQLKVDGDFGTATKSALRAFQEANGLTVDGVYGPETEKALAAFRQSADEKPGQQALLDIGGVREGAGATAVGLGVEVAQSKIEAATYQLQQFEGLSPLIDIALTSLSVAAAVLAIAGIAWAVKGFLDSRKTVEA